MPDVARSAFPILVWDDLSVLLGFYRDVLGGEVVYRFPEDGDPAYVSLRLGESSIGLGVDPSPPRGPQRVSVWVYVADVDAVVAAAVAAGVPVLEEPADQPWGERTARLQDPTGVHVVLGAPLSA
jgi:lactoylglutathione lyase